MEIKTIIGHGGDCCGCYNVREVDGEVLAVCNECGHKLNLFGAALQQLADDRRRFVIGEQQALASAICDAAAKPHLRDAELQRILEAGAARYDELPEWLRALVPAAKPMTEGEQLAAQDRAIARVAEEMAAAKLECICFEQYVCPVHAKPEGGGEVVDVSRVIAACTAYNDHVGRDNRKAMADPDAMRAALAACLPASSTAPEAVLLGYISKGNARSPNGPGRDLPMYGEPRRGANVPVYAHRIPNKPAVQGEREAVGEVIDAFKDVGGRKAVMRCYGTTLPDIGTKLYADAAGNGGDRG